MKLNEAKARLQTAWSNTSIITYLLVVLFGSGSWVAVNGIWVELPIIVQHIPESWSLPSYLTVIIQLANIGPLIFTLGNKFYPRVFREKPAILIVVSTGAVACALLAFFWKETGYVAGAERSIALLILAFFISVVDCTSSVTFLPYMAVFRELYMSPYFVGEGLSGLLPSLVALGQGVGAGASHESCTSPTDSPFNSTSGNGTSSESWGPGPKFSPEVFFWFLSGMMVVSGLAFVGLNTLPVAKRQKAKREDKKLAEEEEEESLQNGKHEMVLISGDDTSLEGDTIEQNSVSPALTIFLLAVLAVINGLSNGVIPAIHSYACIPYSYFIYHLTLTLSSIANPVTCFIFPLIRTKSVTFLTLLSLVYCAMCAYILVVASQSPNVILRCDHSGAVLMVSI